MVAVREGVGQRVPRVKWSWLTAEEADTKSKALFDKADRLYQSQSRKGTDIDVATQVRDTLDMECICTFFIYFFIKV